ncbi:MAG: D-alanyl-D-alanine carboxypeptidase family protein [Microbacterium sp.]
MRGTNRPQIGDLMSRRRRRLSAVLAVLALAVSIAVVPLAAPVADAATTPSVKRLTGSDRYVASVAISKAAFPTGKTAPVVIVSAGEQTPTALSAGPVAAKLGGPVLLTRAKVLPAVVAAEIKRLKPKKIIIVGNTRTISATVAAKLAKLAPTVVRASGSDRYAVSAALVRLGFPATSTSTSTATPTPTASSTPTPTATATPTPAATVDSTTPAETPTPTATESAASESASTAATDAGALTISLASVKTATTSRRAAHVYLTTGVSTAPAIVGGALAARKGAPLLVVDGTASAAKASTLALLSELGTTTVTILGGTKMVSAGIAKSLAAAGLTVKRLSAASASSLAGVVTKAFPSGTSSVLVLPTTVGADAVPAVALAAVRKAPIVLNAKVCAGSTLRAAVKARKATTVTLIGSVGVLRGLVGKLTMCASRTAAKSYWVVVNKQNKLSPTKYVPAHLRLVKGSGYQLQSTAATALEKLMAAAKKAGVGTIRITSGYRSYASQKALHARYLRTMGKTWTLAYSARAGYSEHQTGLAADLVACSSSGCSGISSFGSSKQGKWVAKNAWKYGFVVRYEKGYTKITGYGAEPWHLRYVGLAVAADYHAGGFHTLEQYFGYAAAPNY